MIVEQSAVALNATHEYVHESEISATRSFRLVMDEVSQEASSEGAQLRLVALLQNLITRMLEAISGTRHTDTSVLGSLPGSGELAEAAEAPSGGSRFAKRAVSRGPSPSRSRLQFGRGPRSAGCHR